MRTELERVDAIFCAAAGFFADPVGFFAERVGFFAEPGAFFAVDFFFAAPIGQAYHLRSGRGFDEFGGPIGNKIVPSHVFFARGSAPALSLPPSDPQASRPPSNGGHASSRPNLMSATRQSAPQKPSPSGPCSGRRHVFAIQISTSTLGFGSIRFSASMR
jgi:hypothetical protein